MPAKLNSKAAAEPGSTAFNLVDSAWIPVRDTANVPLTLSLLELFTRAESLTELDLRPHERVSVMRLLACITQAAIGAPEDDSGWNDFGKDLEREVTAYLRMHHDVFALFGD